MLMVFQMVMVLWPQETACEEGPCVVIQGAGDGAAFLSTSSCACHQMCNCHIVSLPPFIPGTSG